MSNNQPDTNHLDDVVDGAGCVEIWETISESRASSQE